MGDNFWGGLVQSLREERGISQRVLSERARVNRSTLRRIESGKTSGDIQTMERVLGYLGYELEALEREGQQARREEIERDPTQRSRLAARRIMDIRLM